MRPENCVPRTCMYTFTINLKYEITFDDVPPLILTVMKVERWTAI
jgi:hypothetical protein